MVKPTARSIFTQCARWAGNLHVTVQPVLVAVRISDFDPILGNTACESTCPVCSKVRDEFRLHYGRVHDSE
jgi:hypothetical protein